MEGTSHRMVRFVFRHQNASFTNDLHDLPQWFHVFVFFFFCKHFRTSHTFHDVRLKKPFDLPQWSHVFFASSLIYIIVNRHVFCYISWIYIYIYVIMDRHEHHNIRNGFVWAQSGHSTRTCTVSLLVIEL